MPPNRAKAPNVLINIEWNFRREAPLNTKCVKARSPMEYERRYFPKVTDDATHSKTTDFHLGRSFLYMYLQTISSLSFGSTREAENWQKRSNTRGRNSPRNIFEVTRHEHTVCTGPRYEWIMVDNVPMICADELRRRNGRSLWIYNACG